MKELDHGDKVSFKVGDKVHEYTVSITFLNHETARNEVVFNALGMTREQRLAIASQHYGYRADQGDWPEYKSNDYAAATRLVKAVYDLCNIYNTKKEHEEIPF